MTINQSGWRPERPEARGAAPAAGAAVSTDLSRTSTSVLARGVASRARTAAVRRLRPRSRNQT